MAKRRARIVGVPQQMDVKCSVDCDDPVFGNWEKDVDCNVYDG